MSDHIHKRLESRIAEAISTMIVTKQIKHPMLSEFVSVSGVSLSSDSAYATIYISTFLDENKLHRSVTALNRASGFIQSRLKNVLNTRHTPQLTFKADLSIKEGQAVNQIIESLDIKDE